MVSGKKQSEPYFPGQSQSTSGSQEMNLINGNPQRRNWAKGDGPGDCPELWVRGPGNCSVESASRGRPQGLGDSLRELRGRLTDQHMRTYMLSQLT